VELRRVSLCGIYLQDPARSLRGWGVSRVDDREEADTHSCHEGRTLPPYGGGVLS